jgi:tetratricopeptide (TPR) repeat protein
MRPEAAEGVFASNPAYVEYERLLLKLHELIRAGEGDAEEADSIRDSMDRPWEKLTQPEVQRLKGLSADLYMLSSEEVFLGASAEERATLNERLREAWMENDYPRVLALLRQGLEGIPGDRVAYLRARCWEELGHFGPAYQFYQFAAQLDPTNPNYLVMALRALYSTGRMDDARKKAEQYLADPGTHHFVLFQAAHVLFSCARSLPVDEARPNFESIVTALQRGLERATEGEQARFPSVLLAARVTFALALSRLNRTDEARAAFNDAIKRHPEDDATWILRGLFELESNTARALDDFREAHRRGAHYVWPYYFLALDSLRRDAFEECINYCSEGIKRTRRDELIANMYEWMAIALDLLGQSQEVVRAFFQEALVRDPLNPRIQRNFQAFQQQPHPAPRFQMDADRHGVDGLLDIEGVMRQGALRSPQAVA